MHLETIPKLFNKCAWDVRGLARSVPVEVIYQGGSEQRPEYIKRIPGPVYLEPMYGYPITADGLLVAEAMEPNVPMPIATWRNGLPSPRWFKQTIRRDLIDYRPSVVSLRHYWEWNYYHFHLDVLGKLKLLNDHGVPRELPLALGRYASEKPFVAELLQKGKLARRDWLIPDADNRRIILADELIYCRIDGLSSYRERARYFLDEMELQPAPRSSTARIFLNREQPALRRIINFSELRPLIERFNFTIVDSARLSVSEQIEIFSGARYLAAVHGAGVTNIIYRRGAPLSLLELHASSFINDDMKNMSDEFGYAYRRLPCSPARGERAPQANIHVRPEELHRALDELLQT